MENTQHLKDELLRQLSIQRAVDVFTEMAISKKVSIYGDETRILHSIIHNLIWHLQTLKLPKPFSLKSWTSKTVSLGLLIHFWITTECENFLVATRPVQIQILQDKLVTHSLILPWLILEWNLSRLIFKVSYSPTVNQQQYSKFTQFIQALICRWQLTESQAPI